MIGQAKDNLDTIIPGYTHLRRAQPILFAHHLMAYVSMFQRDIDRLIDSYKRINVLPLGAGALAGTTFRSTAISWRSDLGLTAYTRTAGCGQRPRLHSGIPLGCFHHHDALVPPERGWCSGATEFNFIELDDAFCTGGIMPQKKNPDVPELVRGKTGRVYGNLMGLLTVLKSLPLAYNKDMQEDKGACSTRWLRWKAHCDCLHR